MKFKVGDKVRCIDSDVVQSHITKGEIYEVLNTCDDMIHVVSDQRTRSWLYSDRFEPVLPSNPLDRQPGETEDQHLKRLVDKANEGQDAWAIIEDNYKNRVEEYPFKDVVPPPGHKDTKLYKIKIVETRRKFRVAQWDAEIVGDKVKIGCQEFDKQDLISNIKDLAHLGISNVGGLYAGRNGIMTDKPNEYITWDQAEQLLKELEAVG